MIKVEIACNGFASSLNALKGGADRIELFENLSEGGCTPSAGMLKKVSALQIPCYVMIRPRGGDFCYNNDEVDIMLQDIEACRKAKVAGIVFGCLTRSGEVDIELNKKLLSAWNHGPATFHRAVDRTNNLINSSRIISEMGFERILSSGGTVHVMDGLDVLKNMHKEVGGNIIIMPGAGVTHKNARFIIEQTGCTEIHATCKQVAVTAAKDVNSLFSDIRYESNADEIALMISGLKTITD